MPNDPRRRRSRRRALIPFLLAAGPAALLAQNDLPTTGVQSGADDVAWFGTGITPANETPEAVIAAWPRPSRLIARTMIDQYGEPLRFGANMLVWENNGPWKRTAVRRSPWSLYREKQDWDYLEQSVGRRVPGFKIAELKRFDRRITVDLINDELSARSGGERTNFLLLNLADEIIRDQRTVENARDFYRKTEELSESGKSSRYLDGLLRPEQVIDPMTK